MPVLWRHNRSSNLDKAKIIVFLLPFLSASHPQSSPDCLSWCLVPLALTGFVRCSVPQFSSSPARPLTPHHRHFGSPSYRFALALLHPPNPLALVRSRHCDLLLLDCYATKLLRPALSSLLRRAGSGTDCPTIHSGGWKCRWRAYLSLEGGNVGVVPVVACGGVQNRPPRAKSPSQYRNILPVGLGSAENGGCVALGRTELSREGGKAGESDGS